MRRKELGPALSASRFLADVVLCLSFKEDEVKDIIVWKLPDGLVHYIDQVMNAHGGTVVEVSCPHSQAVVNTYKPVGLSMTNWPALFLTILSSCMQVVLTALADSPVSPQLRDALGLVLYALCSRYRDATHAALTTTIMSPTFPVRPGLLSQDDKHMFVAAALHHPLHPRRRFQGVKAAIAEQIRKHAQATCLTQVLWCSMQNLYRSFVVFVKR